MPNIPAPLSPAPVVATAGEGFVYSIGVFLSATCQDLQKARDEIVKKMNETRCLAIAMEEWKVDHQKAEDLCLEQLRDHSSHYLGILGLRRGYVPPLLEKKTNTAKKSITEAEYDWAIKFKKAVSIILPRINTPIYNALLARVQQSPESAELVKAQADFRSRVERDTVNYVEEEDEIADDAQIILNQWRDELRRRLQAARAPDPPPVPLHRLGGKAQVKAFVRIIAASSAGTCFLLHGAAGMGQEMLARRLRDECKLGFAAPKFASCAISASWRAGGIRRLFESLSRDLFGSVVSDADCFLTELLPLLSRQDVALQIDDVDACDIPTWVSEFWGPIASGLAATPAAHRLIVIASANQRAKDKWKPALFDYAAEPLASFDAVRPVLLPELLPLTQEEVSEWLQEHGGRSALDSEAIAENLVTRFGGLPDAIFKRLPNESKIP